ncbi:MAG: 2,3,4,5-tetrahydropyridine-2,6-dicarboxylate N-succinyltransferase [Candidatus Puniceispirillum sp.]|nr:2,3,4,5-tetrahydropyridine-2,6-dicarboxylate N-succinyltransferase [Candidatus Pelagibacter sp.]MBA4282897.1 2,3,4,5-tetrahydropyridine-2,6-dicarboxylate N-succinyltransferase [Candidatus Puniceispirillum sp.]
MTLLDVKTAKLIEEAFDNRNNHDIKEDILLKTAVLEIIDLLDQGQIRVCEKKDGIWITNTTVKKAILLSFAIQKNEILGSSDFTHWFDKVDLKNTRWNTDDFNQAGYRSVPGAIVRRGSFIDKGVILMPSFVNIGAYVGSSTMIDTWSTIGSCAQIGKNCHISGGVGIGGVLEPLQANPVIIEDNCFIGARSEIAEGVIVEEGAVISMGVFIGASTKIVDRQTGTIYQGRVPAYSVVIPGVLPAKEPHLPLLSCAVIVKTVDERTRSKTGINDILRDA